MHKLFYAAHAGTRWPIESLWGIFKNRFICLKAFNIWLLISMYKFKGARGHGPLRFQNPEVSASVILACACLQNWLIDNRFEDENDDKEFEENNIEIISNKNDGYNEEPEDNRVEQQKG